MEPQEFISSGVLESYVLGTASMEEITLVRKMENLYPEVSEHIEEIEASLINYSESFTEKLSGGLKKKIEMKLFDTKENQKPKGTLVNINSLSGSSGRMRFAVAASVGLLIGVSAVLYTVYEKLDKAQKTISQLQDENDILANEMGKEQQELNAKSNTLTVLMKPGSKMISLKGMDISPGSSAMIVYNTNTKAVFLDAVSLPVPPIGKQYQLWAMVNGKPVDAGVFTVTGEGFSIQKMRDIPDAEAFAVTLEDAGGRPEPTMDAMYLKGSMNQNS